MQPDSSTVSVIIPTYNRYSILQRTLGSLAEQDLPVDQYEVIVVDNNSSDQTSDLARQAFPFRFTYLNFARETNLQTQAPTLARNLGAQRSQGDVLIFLDDDICINPPALRILAQHCLETPQTIALGSLVLPAEILAGSPFARAFNEPPPSQDIEIHYTFCKTGLLAVQKSAFVALGQFQDPTGDWPNWDDVDFGYRAHLQGYRFLQSAQAIGEHWDYASRSLSAASQRLWRASQAGVRLLQVYPDLRTQFPMFFDPLASLTQALPVEELASITAGNKGFASFARAKPAKQMLHLRLFLRKVSATSPALWTLERISHLLGKSQDTRSKDFAILTRLYNWVLGAYIYRGFRAGLVKYGPLIT